KTADTHYLTVWGVADGKRYCRFEATAGFNLAAMSKDARLLVAHSMDRSGIRVFDLREDSEILVDVPEGYCYNLSTTRGGDSLVLLGGRGVVDSPTAVFLAPFPEMPKERVFDELDVLVQRYLWDGLCRDNEFRRRSALATLTKHADEAAALAK